MNTVDNFVFYIIEFCLSSLLSSYVPRALIVHIQDAQSNAGSV
jgi:uncharacterized membrane protein YraQ (UPF0718 family)